MDQERGPAMYVKCGWEKLVVLVRHRNEGLPSDAKFKSSPLYTEPARPAPEHRLHEMSRLYRVPTIMNLRNSKSYHAYNLNISSGEPPCTAIHVSNGPKC